MSQFSETASASPRQHDLDALRAFAMLLGIALHASLSFFPSPWPVQDFHQHQFFALFMLSIHGFRMPLFFLLSGYFTMQMYRKRGWRALLAQRAKRIVLPCLLGLVTVIPCMHLAFHWALQTAKPKSPLIAAIRAGDASAVRKSIEQGSDLHQPDEALKILPLSWACVVGNIDVVKLLFELEVDVNRAQPDGNTALHAAAFAGHDEIVALLLEQGANPNAVNHEGKTAKSAGDVSRETTTTIFKVLGQHTIDLAAIEQGRRLVKLRLDPLVAVAAPTTNSSRSNAPLALVDAIVAEYNRFLYSDAFQLQLGDVSLHLITSRIFDHLWFLWFLCWFVVAFVAVVWVKSIVAPQPVPAPALTGLLCLLPMTILPQLFMGSLGPDTSLGLVPLPHVLVYYGLFFGFGARYFDMQDLQGRLSRGWWWLLPLGLVVVFPLALATMGQRVVSAVVQSTYTWMISIGLLGLFRATLSQPYRLVRYLADASYWMYLVHLPLVVAGQTIARDWPWSPLVKFVMLNATVTAILLVSYQLLVRHTWLGRLLNGRPEREARLSPTTGN